MTHLKVSESKYTNILVKIYYSHLTLALATSPLRPRYRKSIPLCQLLQTLQKISSNHKRIQMIQRNHSVEFLILQQPQLQQVGNAMQVQKIPAIQKTTLQKEKDFHLVYSEVTKGNYSLLSVIFSLKNLKDIIFSIQKTLNTPK